MPFTLEVEREIRRRAEHRKQELLDAIGGCVPGHSSLFPTDKVVFDMAVNRSVSYWTEIGKRSAGEKENLLPAHFLYPAKPARSVYNSPLIKTSWQTQWKSPPPCTVPMEDQVFVNANVNLENNLVDSDVTSASTFSGDDLEDTYDMDKWLEEALGSALYLNSTTCSNEKSLHSVESFRTSSKSQSLPVSKVQLPVCPMEPTSQEVCQERKVCNMLRDTETQEQIMAQASKALMLCRSSEKFYNPFSLVDAERFLLLASLRKAELEAMGGSLATCETTEEFKGQLCITEVSASLKDDSLKWSKSEHYKDLWFLCVLCYRNQILASNAVAHKPGSKSIKFTGRLQLSNLPTSFVAVLQIYTLRTCRPKQLKEKSKIARVCKKLRRQSKLCCDLSGSSELVHVRNPAFALSGSVPISLSGGARTQILKLEKVPLMSPLQGSLRVQTETSLSSSVEISGFLTILENVGECRAWQRRWCHLHEFRMHFWNYPTDQDKKIPMDDIDLKSCTSDKVQEAPRFLCARRHTLMLEAAHRSMSYDLKSPSKDCDANHTKTRYFFSCDSSREMNSWAAALNQVLSAMRAWNIRNSD